MALASPAGRTPESLLVDVAKKGGTTMAGPGRQQVAQCPNPKCAKPIWNDHPYDWCKECGDPLPDDIKAQIPKVRDRSAAAAKLAAGRESIEQRIRMSKSVLLTTTPSIDGCRITRYLGVESVEFVIGTGAFSEISTSIADFFGLRSSAFENKLQSAKKAAMDALKILAAERGANAVVGVDLDYCEFSGNRIALIINGTLVIAEPNPA